MTNFAGLKIVLYKLKFFAPFSMEQIKKSQGKEQGTFLNLCASLKSDKYTLTVSELRFLVFIAHATYFLTNSSGKGQDNFSLN